LGIIEIIGIAFTLALDAFAVSSATGMGSKNFKITTALKMGLCFGLFQFGMPLLGYFLGNTFAEKISAIDHYICFALLLLIGGKMIFDTIKEWNSDEESSVIADTLSILLIQGVVTSIDALATGVTFAFDDVNVILAAGIIGIVSFALSFAGGYLGKFIGSALGKWASIIGGLVLIGIGTKMLVEGILG